MNLDEEFPLIPDHGIEDAIMVWIEDDYDLVSAWLKWLCDHPEIETFRGGYSGRGACQQWLPAKHKKDVEEFFNDH